MYRNRIPWPTAVAVLLTLSACAGPKPDLLPRHDEVRRLVSEAERLSDDETTRAWAAAATALRDEARKHEDDDKPELAIPVLDEARMAAGAAVASALERQATTEAEACAQDAADAHRSWQDALQMLEQTERVAGRTARGVTRTADQGSSRLDLPEPPASPREAPPEDEAVRAAASAWKDRALALDVPFADLEWEWTRALAAAAVPEIDPGIRDNQLGRAAWAVAALAKRVRTRVAGRRCDELLRLAQTYAGYRDQALWALVDLERGMKDSARRELDEERARMEDRQQKLYESLQQFEGKFASIRREARGTIMSLADILFDFDKAVLRREAELNLAKVAVILQQYPEMHIYVEGHTDNIGTEEYNQKLSEARAKAVYDFLASQGVDAGRMETAGYGFSQPVASNETEEGRQKNRRVDLVIRED